MTPFHLHGTGEWHGPIGEKGNAALGTIRESTQELDVAFAQYSDMHWLIGFQPGLGTRVHAASLIVQVAKSSRLDGHIIIYMRSQILILLLTCSAPALWSQLGQGPGKLPGRFTLPELVAPKDVLVSDPRHYRLDLENDRVRVLHLSLSADENAPLDDDRGGLLVCVKECAIRLTHPREPVQDIHLQAGQTRWVGAEVVSVRNLSAKPTEMLYIQMKRSPE